MSRQQRNIGDSNGIGGALLAAKAAMSLPFADQIGIIAKVLAAMACGGIIGMERELARRPAGFRTHMLIAAACALMVSSGPALIQTYTAVAASESMSFDPFRILEAVVTGIAFLGAGTIIHRKSENAVEGLTTAGSLLLSGTIGVVLALELWVVGVAMTLLAVVTLQVFGRLERWAAKRFGHRGED